MPDGTTAYTYTYNGGQLSQMTVNGKNVTFSYDASGAPQTMTYDGVTYYYITNPMGDVTGIAKGSGTQLVYYYYTAYGTAYVSYNTAYQALGATLSGVNPLFYRGYVYDRETGLYYLQSRYYNPKVGRFINADALVSTGQGLLGNNMFAYCLNNPVNGVDPTGNLTKRQIHDEVLVRICFWSGGELKMYNTTIYYNGIDHKGKWGFCDLYNPNTGEVWELKRFSRAASCSKAAAGVQLSRYVGGRLKENTEIPLTEGHTTIYPGFFTHYDPSANLTYYVWYWDGGGGILFYDYITTKTIQPNYAVQYLPEPSNSWAVCLFPIGLGRTSPVLERDFGDFDFDV